MLLNGFFFLKLSNDLGVIYEFNFFYCEFDLIFYFEIVELNFLWLEDVVKVLWWGDVDVID